LDTVLHQLHHHANLAQLVHPDPQVQMVHLERAVPTAPLVSPVKMQPLVNQVHPVHLDPQVLLVQMVLLAMLANQAQANQLFPEIPVSPETPVQRVLLDHLASLEQMARTAHPVSRDPQALPASLERMANPDHPAHLVHLEPKERRECVPSIALSMVVSSSKMEQEDKQVVTAQPFRQLLMVHQFSFIFVWTATFGSISISSFNAPLNYNNF